MAGRKQAIVPGAIILTIRSFLIPVTVAAMAIMLATIGMLCACSSNAALAESPATIEFSSAVYAVNGSGDATLTIPIMRSGDLSGDVYASIEVAGGTAVVSQDYTLDVPLQASAPIHITPGASQYDVHLKPAGDHAAGEEKIAILRLVILSGASLGPVNVTMVTIHNATAAGTATPVPTASPTIPLPTATLMPTGGPMVVITPSPTPSSATIASAATPTPAPGITGTPIMVPLPSKSPFPGILLTLLAMLGGCALLYRRKN